LLDIINRPAAAVQGAIYHGLYDADAERGFFRGFWNGLAGNERKQFADTLRRAGMPRGWMRGLLGFTGDVALDPLMWVPGVGGVQFAALTKTGKIAEQATLKTLRGGEVIRSIVAGTKAAKMGLAPLAGTFAAQAAQGYRPLVSAFGHGLVKAAPVVGAIGKAGRAMRAAPVVSHLLRLVSTPARMRALGVTDEVADVVHRMLREGAHESQWAELLGVKVADDVLRGVEKEVGFRVPDLLAREAMRDAIQSKGSALTVEHMAELIAKSPERAGGITAEQMLRGATLASERFNKLLAGGGQALKDAGVLRYLYGEAPAAKLAKAEALESKLMGKIQEQGVRRSASEATALSRISSVADAMRDAQTRAREAAKNITVLKKTAQGSVLDTLSASRSAEAKSAAEMHHLIRNLFGDADRSLLNELEMRSLDSLGVPLSFAKERASRYGMDDLVSAIDSRLKLGLEKDVWSSGLNLGTTKASMEAERLFDKALIEASQSKPLLDVAKKYGRAEQVALSRARAKADRVVGGMAFGEGQTALSKLRGVTAPRLSSVKTLEVSQLSQRHATRLKTLEKRLARVRAMQPALREEVAKTSALGYLPNYGFEDEIGKTLASLGDAGKYMPENTTLSAGLRSEKRRVIHVAEQAIRNNDELAAEVLGIPVSVVRSSKGGARQIGTVPEVVGKYLGDVNRTIANRKTITELVAGVSRGGPFKKADDARQLLAGLGEDFGLYKLPWKDEYHIIPRGVMRELERTVAPAADDVSKVLRLHDKLLSAWKTSTLFLPPHVFGYTARNKASDSLNAIADDLFHLPSWVKAEAHFSGKMAKGGVDLGSDFLEQAFESGGKKYSIKRFVPWSEMDEIGAAVGLSGRGLTQSLLSGTGGKVRIRPLSELPGTLRKAWTYSKGLMTGIPSNVDDASRMGAFITALRQGNTVKEAAFRVHKALYDYGDLTKFERTVMKRVFPFYTWTRRNLPTQIARHVSSPGRITLYDKIRRNVEDSLGERRIDRDILPEWLKDRFGIQVGGSKDFPVFLSLGGFVPMLDIMNVRSASDIFRMAKDQLGPVPKELMAQWQNYDSFWKQDLERFRGETEKFLGMPMPRRWTHVFRNVRLLTWIDRFAKRQQDASGFFLGSEPISQALTGLAPYTGSREKWMWANYYSLRDTYEGYRQSSRDALRQGRKDVAAERMEYADMFKAQMRALEKELKKPKPPMPKVAM